MSVKEFRPDSGMPAMPAQSAVADMRSMRHRAAMNLLKDIFTHLGWRSWIFMICMVLCAGTGLLPSSLFRYFALNVPTETPDPFIVHLAIFGFSVAIAFAISSWVNTLVREWIGMKVEIFLRTRILDQVHRLPLEALDAGQRGDLLTSMSKDIVSVELFFMNSIPGQIRDLTIIVGTVSMFVWYSGIFALIPLGTAACLLFFTFYMQRKLSPYLQELRFLRGGIFQVMIESLEGVRTIRSHQSESYVEQRFKDKLIEARAKTLYVARHVGLLSGQTEFFTKSLIAICLCVDGWLYSRGIVSLEEAFIYPFFTGLFYDSVSGFADKIYHWNQFFNEASRVAEFIYAPGALVQNTLVEIHSSQKLLSQVHSLSLQDLSLGYPGKTLIAPFDFTLKKGDLWAIVGPSGCGKSTLLEVMAGLRAAHSLKAGVLSQSHHRLPFSVKEKGLLLPVELCAYVEQHPYLFEGTLRENLTLGTEKNFAEGPREPRVLGGAAEGTAEGTEYPKSPGGMGTEYPKNPEDSESSVNLGGELWACLETVGLSELFASREGLESKILDRGRNLSVGERYRVGLCRAILLQRPFLLLDEPFAALDEESTRKVADCLNRNRAHLGIALVTHVIPKSLNVTGTVSVDGRMAHVRGVGGFRNGPVPIEGPQTSEAPPLRVSP